MSSNNLRDFLGTRIWRYTDADRRSLPLLKRWGIYLSKVVMLVIRGFTDKGLGMQANSLTYSLFFATIPLLSMVLAVARGFGFADVLQDQLNNTILADTNIVSAIMGMVNRYLETAQGGVFIGVGIIILLWAVYSFFQTAEQSLNSIWDVRQSRSLGRRLMSYLSILILIPLLLIVSSGVNVFLQSIFEGTVWENDSTGRFIQFLVSWAFTLWIYIAIPNTKVTFRAAIIPAVLIGTLFQLLQILSVRIISLLSRTSIVYGAFGGLVILMTLLNWTALLLLIGAQLTYAIQNNSEYDYKEDIDSMSRRYKDFVTLYLLRCIIARFSRGETPYTATELATENRLPARLVRQLLERLIEIGILHRVYIEGKEEQTIQPAMDIHLITVGMVTDRIDAQGTEEFIRGADAKMLAFWDEYKSMRTNTTLYETNELLHCSTAAHSNE